MPDNPRPTDRAWFALPGQRVVALHGRDAVAFAQAQFMNDVAALGLGEWQWNGWLTPKGRVVALFALLRVDDDGLWLLLADADPAGFAAALQRFVFRARLAIEVPAGLHAAGAFAAPAQAGGSRFAGDAAAGIELDFGGAACERSLRISRNAAPDDPRAATRWAACDLLHGLPRLPPSQSGQWTPQQLSLQRLRAYSVRKGCYPGQEIVSRTHFLGTAKRALALLEGEGAMAVGDEVSDGNRVLGTLVSAASADGEHRALAVLPLEPAAAALQVDGTGARKIAFAEGLAR